MCSDRVQQPVYATMCGTARPHSGLICGLTVESAKTKVSAGSAQLGKTQASVIVTDGGQFRLPIARAQRLQRHHNNFVLNRFFVQLPLPRSANIAQLATSGSSQFDSATSP